MSEYIINDEQIVENRRLHGKKLLVMPVIVRCRDCDSASFDEFGGGWCNENCREIKAWNFCAWGERKEA